MAQRKTAAQLHRLTTRAILEALTGDHSDGGGLVLRVEDERAGWVFRYTAPTGRRREMGLGICFRQNQKLAGESVRSAREKASQARAMLEAVPPLDPIDERTKARRDAAELEQSEKAARHASDITLARASRTYHERFVEPRLSTAQSARWIGALEKHVPHDIWNKPIRKISRAELLDLFLELHTCLADTASRVRRRLDEIFDDAMDRDLVQDNPVAALRDKVRRRRLTHRVTPRPSLPYPEVPAFLKELEGRSGVSARCLEFVILTAARTGEAIGARWEEFDLEAGLWTVPAERMKGREDHTVALVPRALQILQAMREVGSPWVFPSPTDATRPLSNMGMLILLQRMNRPDITVHGFRASFSTWANETDAARPDVIEACLAHKEGDRIRAAYNRAKFKVDRQQLLLAWERFVCGTNVISMPASRAA